MAKRLIFFAIFISGVCVPQEHFSSRKKITIISTDEKEFIPLKNELHKRLSNYEIHNFLINDRGHSSEENKKFLKDSEDLVITIGNKGLAFAQNQQREIKMLSLMALDLDKAIKEGRKEIAGIQFEIPAFNILSNYQRLLNYNIEMAYTFYRSSVDSAAIKKHQQLLKKISINLIAYDVESTGKEQRNIHRFIKDKLKSIERSKVLDNPPVVLLQLDSAFLNNSTFQKIWLPFAKRNTISFVAGTENLSRPSLNFCSFSLSPSIEEMALQASELVHNILELNTSPTKIGLEHLLSTSLYLNIQKAKALNLNLSSSLPSAMILRQ